MSVIKVYQVGKATTIKKLFVRTLPSKIEPPVGLIEVGIQLAYDGYTTEGETINGNSKWFFTHEGNWFWSGGVEDKDKQISTSSFNQIINYNEIIKLPNEYKTTRGAGVKIGVLDTGCSSHTSLSSSILCGYNFIDKDDNYSDESNVSHGTFVSGIIASNYTDNTQVVGVSPEAKLVIAKISKQRSLIEIRPILDGLKYLIEQECDIINCSLDFYSGNLSDNFKQLFNECNRKNILLTAAGQDNDGLFRNSIYYPAEDEFFISVGSINKQVLDTRRNEGINPRINYLLQELPFKSTTKYNLFDSKNGSSFATAYVTGAIALIISASKSGHTNESPAQILDSYSNQLSNSAQFANDFKIFKA